MATKVRPFQLYDQKFSNGLMTEEHIANFFGIDPYYANKTVQNVMEVNYGETFYSMVDKKSKFVTPQREYRWRMQGKSERNFVLLNAWADSNGLTAITSIVKPGINGSTFYLDFAEKAFDRTQIIVGMRPDLYRVWIKDTADSVRQVSQGIWRYECQLIGDENAWIPQSELVAGTRWSGDGGLVPNTMSDKGYGINYTSPFELKNRMTQFRLEETISGDATRIGKNGYVMRFFLKGDDGKPYGVWMDYFTAQFLRKAMVEKAKTAYFSKSNETTNGQTLNIGNNGFAADSGSGFEEMCLMSNTHAYDPNNFSLSHLRDLVLDTMESNHDVMGKEVVIGAGLRGLSMLKEAVQRELSTNSYQYMGDNTGRAYSRNGNDIEVGFGNITGFADIFNIRFKFMHLPHKDDTVRNKLRHPKGGVVSSYELDVMNLNKTANGTDNIQLVELAGQSPIFAVQEGMRGGIQSGNSMSSAKNIATPVDGSKYHYMDWTGFVVWNPTDIVRLKPTVLYQ